MDDLVQFLRDRLDDDETIAREAAHLEEGHWTTEGGYPVSVADELVQGADVFERVVAFDEGSPSKEQATHIARHDPARVLAEVQAKRRMIGRIDSHATIMGWDEVHGDLLRLLAVPYADHPDYKDTWRP